MSHASRILVIEDDAMVARGLKRVFLRCGREVSWAQNLAEAREQAQQHLSAVVVDLDLPDGSGLDLVKEWSQEGKAWPIVFYSATGDLNQVEESLSFGSFIPKSAGPHAVLLALFEEEETKSGERLRRQKSELSGESEAPESLRVASRKA